MNGLFLSLPPWLFLASPPRGRTGAATAPPFFVLPPDRDRRGPVDTGQTRPPFLVSPSHPAGGGDRVATIIGASINRAKLLPGHRRSETFEIIRPRPSDTTPS